MSDDEEKEEVFEVGENSNRQDHQPRRRKCLQHELRERENSLTANKHKEAAEEFSEEILSAGEWLGKDERVNSRAEVLITGSPIMTALKIGSPSKKENASRFLTMYQSLFVAQPNRTAGWLHHNTALAMNRIVNT